MDNSFKYLISPENSKPRNFSPKLRIAILASGEGSNFQELIDLSKSNKFDIDIKILITIKILKQLHGTNLMIFTPFML